MIYERILKIIEERKKLASYITFTLEYQNTTEKKRTKSAIKHKELAPAIYVKYNNAALLETL